MSEAKTDEAVTFARIHELLNELDPLLTRAAKFPNPMGGSTDERSVYFGLNNGREVLPIMDYSLGPQQSGDQSGLLRRR
jgi:hypothetical protein